MKKRKNIIIVSMICAILLMAVGYAYFATQLNINATGNITSNWNVYFSNITEGTVVGSASNAKTPSVSGTTATIEANLISPGDSITYELTLLNGGTIGAIIEDIQIEAEGSSAINYSIAGIKKGDKLAGGDSKTIVIKIEYNVNITSQPNELSKTITITVDTVQDIGQTITPDTAEIANARVYISNVNSVLSSSSITEGECEVTSTGLNCDGTLISVDGPSSGTIIVADNEVQYVEGLDYTTSKISSGFNGTLIESDNRQICKAVDEDTRLQSKHYAFEKIGDNNETILSTTLSYIGNIPEGNYEPGDEYLCEVKPGVTYRFYVLSTSNLNGEIITESSADKEITTVNLIMDQNITSSGTPATSDDPGTVAWVTDVDFDCRVGTSDWCGDTSKGPITAMNFLTSAVSDWINVEEKETNYTVREVLGYESEPYDPIYSNYYDYKFNITTRARMIYYEEAYAVGCLNEVNVTNGDVTSKYYYDTCPLWLYNNLQYKRDISNGEFVPEGATIIANGPRGYWTLNGSNQGWNAFEILDHGNLNSKGVNTSDYNGVRPIINIDTNNICN